MISQLNQVRNYMMLQGTSISSQPVTQISVEARMAYLFHLTKLVEMLGRASQVSVDAHEGLYSTAPGKPINPLESLSALTDLLAAVLGTYHILGLGSYAEAAFDEAYTAVMSGTEPNYQNVIDNPTGDPFADGLPIQNPTIDPFLLDDTK